MVVDNSGGLTLGTPYVRNFVVTSSAQSVGVNETVSYEIDMTQTNYELIGILGVAPSNPSSLAITKFWNSGNTATIVAKNVSSNSLNPTVQVKGLYRYKK